MADADVMDRDKQGEWQPEQLPKPAALFTWPPKLKPILRFLFGWGGVLWPFDTIIFGLAIVSWFYLTPSMERMSTFSFDWIALIYLRNAGLMTLFAGAFHFRLYTRKRQGTKYKYSDKWLATKDKKYTFNNQLLDNIFWSLISGCVVWTAYEALTMWAYANEVIPFIVDWRSRPVYSVLLMVFILFWRNIHFYWIHRPLHWKPLYKRVHYLHHRNINVSPWSGNSMHPIEHLIFYTGVFLFWIVPSHPLHAMAYLMHDGLNPSKGHSGFYKIVLGRKRQGRKERTIPVGSYFHYLHHKYFTVNFGNPIVPLDKWFGTFYDGSPESHAAMVERRKARARRKLGKE
jgi:sterol desaturase/sphingolipid hydroxylase (fatty acid hydroxylase superfamily)